MTEEQDPPSFKAARRRDRERLLQLEADGTDLDEEISELEAKIEEELEKMRAKLGGKYAKYSKMSNFSPSKPEKNLSEGLGCGTGTDSGLLATGILVRPSKSENLNSIFQTASSDAYTGEEKDAADFIAEETLSSITDIVSDPPDAKRDISPSNVKDIDSPFSPSDKDSVLMPPPKIGVLPLPIGLGLKDTIQEYLTPTASLQPQHESVGATMYEGKLEKKFDVKNFARNIFDEKEDVEEELDLTGIDDDEIDGYIMSPEGNITTY